MDKLYEFVHGKNEWNDRPQILSFMWVCTMKNEVKWKSKNYEKFLSNSYKSLLLTHDDDDPRETTVEEEEEK